jgi:FAD/FMN-containing dehydrogenase
MPFSRDTYRALEDIVGSRYISDDPAVLVSYQFPLASTSIHIGPFYRTCTPRGAAVLLPGNTEEVQKIVKTCNKYKVKYKASSTFWGAMGFPCQEDVVQLDMRRMDRILEIDQKNMFAVIEPHVIGVNLQAEAMKVGLNTHIIGAGGSCSPLASATSYAGPGPDSLYMGNGDENLLGAEWVMPDGEVIRTGSMGCGSGWFCGEGPGPGVKGLIRGNLAARGAMGVYTRCALKLYPWPGPASFSVEGRPPAYEAILPDNIRAYTLAFPSWESWADCAHRIWNAGIGYIAHRQFNMFGRDLKFAMIKILTDSNRTLSDLEQLANDPEIKKTNESMMREFQFVLAGMTPRDMGWQEKALDKILAETGGWKVDAMSDPQLARWVLAYLVRLGHKNLNLVFAGGYEGCFGTVGPPDYGSAWVEETSEFKKIWEEKGAIVRAGGDCTMGGLGGLGGGAYIMWENFTCWDPHDKDSVEGTFQFFEATDRFARKRNLGLGMERTNALCRGSDGKEVPKEVRDRVYAASPQAHVFHYQQKIREAFNPNDLGDSYYVTL